MKVARWPAILLIVALIVAALLSGDGGTEPVTSSTRDLATLGPVVARADALSALWFCNGGTAVDNGIADHRVVLVNTTDAERSGSLTAYASKPATGARPQPVRRSWTLAPRTRAEYRLAEVVGQAAYASATVEVTGGGVLVEHSVSSPLGTDRGPCASSASSTWWVPVGTTATVGDAPIARELLVFFNPFPGDAVVDVAFSTDSGFRGTPELFKGLVVPGGSVVGVDLASAGVAVAAEVATAVTARSGRVVVDRIQAFADGQSRRGIAVSSGLAAPAPAWVFAAGRLGAGRQERVVVYNPNEFPAEVDVEVRPQDTAVAVEPFQLTVRPGQHSQLDLHNEPRLAALVTSGADYALVVRSADGSAIVAERLVTVAPGSPGAGVAVSTGTAVASTRLYADVADADQGTSSLVLMNPNEKSIARIRLVVLAGATATPSSKYSSIELQPGSRLTVPLADLGRGVFTVIVEATAPVVAERELVGPTDRAVAGAVPDSVSLSLLDLGGFLSLGN